MAVSADGTQHVPAWKRLGLKLKNAAETPTESNNEPNVQQNRAHGDTSQIARISDDRLSSSKGKTSKRSRDDSGESHDSKKRRISNADHASLNVSSPAASKQIIEHSTDTPAKASLDDAELSKTSSSLRRSPSKGIDRRKSVTFSNDTKTEDGDSAYTLFKAWSAEQSSGAPANEHEMSAEEIEYYSSLERKAAEAAAEQAEKAATETKANSKSKESELKEPKSKESKSKESKTKDSKQKEVTQKESKKSKKNKSSTAVPSPDKKVKTRSPKPTDKPTPPYVDYLTQYHNDKANWKFNKSKQTDLLKNIWNIYRVRPEHNDALSEYISGLQGAAARSRLRSSAKKIISDSSSFLKLEESADASDMESAVARHAAYEAALARELATLKQNGVSSVDAAKHEKTQSLQQKQQEDERAARMLIVLMEEDLGEELGIEAKREAAAAAAKAKENETARSRKKKRKSRTETNESDSDSSDGSDSDEEEKTRSKKVKLVVKRKEAADDSSSSEESDSETSSDDDSSDSSSDGDSDSDDSSSETSDGTAE